MLEALEVLKIQVPPHPELYFQQQPLTGFVRKGGVGGVEEEK